MTSFFSQTTSAIQRAHDGFSHTLTVHDFAYDSSGGTNAYADGSWTESSTTIQGTVRTPEQPMELEGPDGDDVAIDVVIYVNPGAVDVATGVEDETRATEFTDSATGRRYRAVNVRSQESLLAIDCELI